MPIFSVRGDIYRVGPQVAEFIGVWLRSGYNDRFGSWNRFIHRHGHSLAKVGNREGSLSGLLRTGQLPNPLYAHEPWQFPEDTLCEFVAPIGNCKFVFILSNPGDPLGCSTVEDVREMVLRCLDAAADVGAKSVALIHIPTVQFHDVPTPEDNDETATAMVDTASMWILNQQEQDFSVYMVDFNDHFEGMPGVVPFQPGDGPVTNAGEPTTRPEDFIRTTDDQGRLVIDHNLGEGHALQDIRVRLEPLPVPGLFQGSRLHILNLVDHENFASQTELLLGLQDVEIANGAEAVPIGHANPDEMSIENYLQRHCGAAWPAAIRQLRRGRWWAPFGGSKPQMDLICKIRVAGKPGLLFIEAKAHEGELGWGAKPLADDASEGSRQNHQNIAAQIQAANADLNRNSTPGFNLSINNHYQLANRITYLWKLSSLGIPVVLLYLGFTGDHYFPADYFRDDRHWTRVMGGYLQGVVPQSFPEWRFTITNGGSLEMLVRSLPIG